jgi:DNA-binding CsgD family transcriptional regulator
MHPVAELACQLNHLDTRDEYLRAATDLLMGLFPSDHIAWNGLDSGSAEVVSYTDIAELDLAEKLIAASVDHPAVLSYMGETGPAMWLPRRISDLVSDLVLHETHAYQILLKPYEADRELTILVARPGVSSGCVWGMARHRADYTDSEVSLARQIQPVLRLLETAYPSTDRQTSERFAAEAYSLTAREQEVMRLVARGLTSVGIGHLLGISHRTVTTHLEHAYVKLGCNNRIDAIRRFSATKALF